MGCKLLERGDLPELKFYTPPKACPTLAWVGQHTTLQDGSIGSMPKGRMRMARMDAAAQKKQQQKPCCCGV
jgi:hypothetical protein